MVHSLAFTIKDQPDVDKSTIHGWGIAHQIMSKWVID